MSMFACLRKMLAYAAAGLCFMATIPAMASEEAPDALIERLSNEVLETIRKDPQLRAGDTARINALIDEKVLPYVDFEKMTRLAVGRGWRQASEAQRTQLVEGFRTLLIRTYSGALSEVKDQKIEMLPLRMNPGDPYVLVRSKVLNPGTEAVQLDYRLEKTAAGWKIFDINVLGIWLVANYKNQFASTINTSGIDGLIKQLGEQNQNPGDRPAAAKHGKALAEGQPRP